MKKFVCLISTICIVASFIPSALADKSDYVGSYYTLNSDAPGYAAVDIESCTDSAINLRFKRIKNNEEAYTYSFEQGVVEGNYAAVPFTATITQSNATFKGVMTLEFLNKMIDIRLISGQGVEMYSGHLPKVDHSYFDDSKLPTVTSTPTAAPVASAAPAAATHTSEISYDVSVSLNGTKLKFDNSARPLIQNNFTYVPLRSVFSNMGINVYWDDYQLNEQLREQLITCTKNNTIIQFARTSNNSGANVWTLKKWDNGTTYDPSTSAIDITTLQPIIINNRSYVPLRVISESLGADVQWDDSTRTVVINCNTDNAYWYSSDTIGKQEDYTLSAAQGYITSDYTFVETDVKPYFSPQSKFYMFKANDMYGKVALRIYYGGYIDVLPEVGEAQAHDNVTAPATDNTNNAPQADVVPEQATENAAPIADENTTGTPEQDTAAATDTTGVTTTTKIDENGNEITTYHFDMTEILGSSEGI